MRINVFFKDILKSYASNNDKNYPDFMVKMHLLYQDYFILIKAETH